MVPGDEPPDYKVYRSRPRGPLARLRGKGEEEDLERYDRGDRGREPDRGGPDFKRYGGRRRGGGGAVTPGRVLKWVALVLVGWVLLSVVLFLVSAQVQKGKISEGARSELDGGVPLFSKKTILVLGTDQRPKNSKEPGANSGPPRTDSIMLMRVGGGAAGRLSIPRDTVVDIPGRGRNKINAAYAFGGTALTVKTVKQFLGISIDHVVEVDFTNFPKFIDTLGGIDVKTGCVRDLVNGGDKNGGVTIDFKPGVHHMNGRKALAYSRVRKNSCRPGETDLARAKRQQEVFSAMKDQITSFHTFLRLPWVSWRAPKVIRTDMGGFSLLGLAAAIGVGGNPTPNVLKPTGIETTADGGSGLTVDDATKRSAVEKFLGG
jgi:LCP family protein required for cell wall assembly